MDDLIGGGNQLCASKEGAYLIDPEEMIVSLQGSIKSRKPASGSWMKARQREKDAGKLLIPLACLHVTSVGTLQFPRANLMRNCAPVAMEAMGADAMTSLQVDCEAGRDKRRMKIGVVELVKEVFDELREGDGLLFV
jgi:hypothetical protein